jgi:hypothetical protein
MCFPEQKQGTRKNAIDVETSTVQMMTSLTTSVCDKSSFLSSRDYADKRGVAVVYDMNTGIG